VEVGHYDALDGLVEFFKTITTKKQKNTSNSFLEREEGACGGVELISKEGRRMCEL